MSNGPRRRQSKNQAAKVQRLTARKNNQAVQPSHDQGILPPERSSQTIIFKNAILVFVTQGDFNLVRDVNTINGPGIIAGKVDGSPITQIVNTQVIEWDQAVGELQRLRARMKELAHDLHEDHDREIGQIASAEHAAREKNPSNLSCHLKSAGNFALDVAKSIGAEIIVAMIKAQTGMAG